MGSSFNVSFGQSLKVEVSKPVHSSLMYIFVRKDNEKVVVDELSINLTKRSHIDAQMNMCQKSAG